MKRLLLLAMMSCFVSLSFAGPIYEVGINEACRPEVEAEVEAEDVGLPREFIIPNARAWLTLQRTPATPIIIGGDQDDASLYD
ncbi:MAG: hypothetical protein LBJ98_00735 [Endomicrobium sp.]|jgi:hypothetical protein|nr:hypothetical protein [Endomicrobium sp.]